MNRQPQIALFARCATIDKAFSPPRTQQKPDAPVARRRHCRENPSKSSHERTQTRHPGTLPAHTRSARASSRMLEHPQTPSPQFPRRGTRARPLRGSGSGESRLSPSAEGGFRSKFGDMSDPRAPNEGLGKRKPRIPQPGRPRQGSQRPFLTKRGSAAQNLPKRTIRYAHACRRPLGATDANPARPPLTSDTIELGIHRALRTTPPRGEQLVGGAVFHDAAVVEHEHAIDHGRDSQTMRDQQRSSTPHQVGEIPVDGRLRHGIKRASGLIEQHDTRAGAIRCTRDGDALPLTSR